MRTEQTSRLWDEITCEWEPVDPKLAAVAVFIPPGKALRRYQQVRDKALRHKPPLGTGSPRRQLTDTEQIASGGRTIVNDALNGIKKTGRIELKTEDGDRWVRRTGEQPCGECSLCKPDDVDRALRDASTSAVMDTEVVPLEQEPPALTAEDFVTAINNLWTIVESLQAQEQKHYRDLLALKHRVDALYVTRKTERKRMRAGKPQPR